ncbi:MAG: hypothetical protein L3J91_05755 [Thermoplasmata archaeon]|nr:hypothetical protein [Thermoplasmata archaeon]
MLVRTFVTLVYVVAVAIAIVLQFFIPGLAVLLLYGLLGWFIVSIFVYRLPVMSRPLFGGPAAAPAAPPPLGVPLTSTPGGTQLSFCAYCATPVEPGTPICPACHHSIPVF